MQNHSIRYLFFEEKSKFFLLFMFGFVVSFDAHFAIGFLNFSVGEFFVFFVLFYFLFEEKGSFAWNSSLDRSLILLLLYCMWVVFILLLQLNSETLSVARDVIVLTLYYFFVISLANDESDFIFLMKGFSFGVILNCSIAASQVLFNWPRFISLEAHGASEKEALDGGALGINLATGIFPHPNALGFILIPSILIELTLVGKQFRLMGISRAAFMLIILYFTQSKGAILWVFFGCVLILFFKFRELLSRALWFLLLSSFLILTIYSIFAYALPYLVDEGRGGTVLARVIFSNIFYEAVSNDWKMLLFGGAYNEISMWSGFYSSFSYANAHNTILNQVVFFGVFGLFFLLLFLVHSVWLGIELMKKNDYFGSALLASLLAAVGGSYFEPLHKSFSGIGVIIFLAGVLAIRSRIVGNKFLSD